MTGAECGVWNEATTIVALSSNTYCLLCTVYCVVACKLRLHSDANLQPLAFISKRILQEINLNCQLSIVRVGSIEYTILGKLIG